MKLTEHSADEAAFYFKVIDMLVDRPRTPNIVLASPNIPNPEVYFEALPNNQIDKIIISNIFSPTAK